ncbi:MAG: hypothetical protein HXX10_12635 [Rhodoplanes sp.]|uniref:hypothetical protein n=1 Tax=Rhodoplanes sp. TaxID=1968906 RepID=UPI00185546B8|nr:hypothetical protein [Rhodoplanes sp.]NVO14874.1 hypothetical protein [Rhodoplanes sp.]
MNAEDAGLALGTLKTCFVGKAKATAKAREERLRDALKTLAERGDIWGPVKHGSTQYYFAAGRGPSIETASALLVRLVLQSGTRLLSRPGLEKKVTGMHRRFFPDAVKHAIAGRAIVELTCGKSKYYLHCDVAAERFAFETTTMPVDPSPVPGPNPPHGPSLRFEDLLPVYRRLKAQQGGFSAVKIFDLMKALNVPKEALHTLLVQEAKAGRITIHPTTSVELPREVIDAGIRLDGFAEPFITVVVKDDR